MAETDFSSSSPLAGSFLTGHIFLPLFLPMLARAATLCFLFFAVWQGLLYGCFTRIVGLFRLWFLRGQGFGVNMS